MIRGQGSPRIVSTRSRRVASSPTVIRDYPSFDFTKGQHADCRIGSLYSSIPSKYFACTQSPNNVPNTEYCLAAGNFKNFVGAIGKDKIFPVFLVGVRGEGALEAVGHTNQRAAGGPEQARQQRGSTAYFVH